MCIFDSFGESVKKLKTKSPLLSESYDRCFLLNIVADKADFFARNNYNDK